MSEEKAQGLRPDLVWYNDPVKELPDLATIFEDIEIEETILYPYQEELLKRIIDMDLSKAELRFFIHGANYGIGKGSFEKALLEMQERRYFIKEEKQPEKPRIDRPHYRTLEKRNKKRMF